MVNKVDFIKNIIIDILKLPLTSETYSQFGGSRNIFYNCINRKSKSPYIGDGCAETLKNLIVFEANQDCIKKINIEKSLKKFLVDEELHYLKSTNNNIETLAKLVIQKFTHPNNKYFCSSGSVNQIKVCSLKEKEISQFIMSKFYIPIY